ncbi:hypothetical protein F2P81_017814 [Scophthalmus maximus]|uniref:Uncharacterized protein n=1 Tax=Scophthalmus maximus TaxID=52904 RepID=A0A6A4S837_SCOMX|nr:hypothetical protein F2P81_017814 [Scophthalmus maximus]
MAPPGGKINRPKTELGRNLFKRRRVLGREKKKKRQIVGAVVDQGLITIHHLKKRNESDRFPPLVYGRVHLSFSSTDQLKVNVAEELKPVDVQVESEGEHHSVGEEETEAAQTAAPHAAGEEQHGR